MDDIRQVIWTDRFEDDYMVAVLDGSIRQVVDCNGKSRPEILRGILEDKAASSYILEKAASRLDNWWNHVR